MVPKVNNFIAENVIHVLFASLPRNQKHHTDIMRGKFYFDNQFTSNKIIFNDTIFKGDASV